MHICFFSVPGISKSLTHAGGVQTHTKNLVSILIETGHEVSLITGAGETMNAGKLSVISVNSSDNGWPNKLWIERAPKVFLDINNKKRIDCIISQGGAVLKFINFFKIKA